MALEGLDLVRLRGLSVLDDTSCCLRPLLPAGQDIVVVAAAVAAVGGVGGVCLPPPGTWSLSG